MTDPRSPVRTRAARAATARPGALQALMVQLLGWSLLAMAVILALESAG